MENRGAEKKYFKINIYTFAKYVVKCQEYEEGKLDRINAGAKVCASCCFCYGNDFGRYSL
jgi:hypothetical protein